MPAPTQPATAPAQRVVVTDQLAPNLDWTSLRFAEFGFGDTVVTVPPDSQYYFQTLFVTIGDNTFSVEVELSFDSETGILRAVFQSLDPATGLPPDALTGFLPPEDGTGIGQGYFAYTVRPDAGLPTGTETRNIALIRFDDQPAIATNQIDPQDPAAGTDPNREAFNTIDAGLPTSSVQPLPDTTTTGQITWSGTDDAGGSGVGMFDIHVSDNGGPFTLWLAGTAATGGVYPGQNGHAYSFYSVATDNVGNVQATPAGAQAMTTFDIDPPTVQQIVVNGGAVQRSRVTSLAVQFNSVVQLPIDPAAAFALTGPTGPVALTVDTKASTPLQTIATLTFSGAGSEFGSLADGVYTLTVLAGQVHDSFGNALDGNGDGTGGDNYATPTSGAGTIHRLFGDIDGDADNDAFDFLAFRLTSGLALGDPGFNSNFDFDGDGDVDALDFLRFRARFGTSV